MKVYKYCVCRVCGKKRLVSPSRFKERRCNKCTAEYQNEYRSKSEGNRQRNKDTCNRYQRKLRRTILEHYSNSVPAKCIQCGESRYVCLELDHINEDGAEHGKKLCKSKKYRAYRGMNSYIYRDIKKNGYPTGYQTLCANCHRVKTFEYLYGKD